MAGWRGWVTPLTFRNTDVVQLRLRDRSQVGRQSEAEYSWRAVEASFENACVWQGGYLHKQGADRGLGR